jgi:hypothetical protein
MGTWGLGVYENDDALDFRGAFLESLDFAMIDSAFAVDQGRLLTPREAQVGLAAVSLVSMLAGVVAADSELDKALKKAAVIDLAKIRVEQAYAVAMIILDGSTIRGEYAANGIEKLWVDAVERECVLPLRAFMVR